MTLVYNELFMKINPNFTQREQITFTVVLRYNPHLQFPILSLMGNIYSHLKNISLDKCDVPQGTVKMD